jgi:hypothetical protein
MIVIMGSSYKTNTHQKQEPEMPTPLLPAIPNQSAN